MLTEQLSVFLENKTGRLNDVAHLLGKEGINMSAFSIADNTDFGILRVIVNDSAKALKVLKEAKFAVTLTKVICIKTSDKPGALANILDLFSQKGIYIDYMYAFTEGEQAMVIIKSDKIEECEKLLQENKIALIAANELYK